MTGTDLRPQINFHIVVPAIRLLNGGEICRGPPSLVADSFPAGLIHLLVGMLSVVLAGGRNDISITISVYKHNCVFSL